MSDWTAARQAWESGDSLRDVSALVGYSYETVRKRAKDERWVRPEGTLDARRQRQLDAVKAMEAENGRRFEENRRRWEVRRQEEADAAGLTAGLARTKIVEALNRDQEKLVRAAAIAYGILIDKAQLLSGGSTSRTETVDHVDAELVRLAQEVKARADARS